MRYAVETGLRTMIYITKFYGDLFSHSQVDTEDTQTHEHTESMEIANFFSK
jgi:hypothetical protein